MMHNVDIEVLKECKNLFEDEKTNFINQTYNTFLSSYLKNSNDAFINIMASNIESIYEEIKKGYYNLSGWFNDYLVNISSLENYLSGEGKIGLITDQIVRNFADHKLSTLRNKKFKIINLFRR